MRHIKVEPEVPEATQSRSSLLVDLSKHTSTSSLGMSTDPGVQSAPPQGNAQDYITRSKVDQNLQCSHYAVLDSFDESSHALDMSSPESIVPRKRRRGRPTRNTPSEDTTATTAALAPSVPISASKFRSTKSLEQQLAESKTRIKVLLGKKAQEESRKKRYFEDNKDLKLELERVKSLSAPKEKAAKEEIARIEVVARNLNRKVGNLEGIIDRTANNANRESSRLGKEVECLKGENLALKDAIETREATIDMLEKKTKDLVTLEDSKANITAKEAEISVLKQQLEDARGERDRIVKHCEDTISNLMGFKNMTAPSSTT